MGRGMPDGSDRRQLTVDVRRVGSSAVVAPGGELDHHSAEKLRESLDACIAEGCNRIVVDCSALEFCDSTGLNVLLTTRLELEAAGGEMHLADMLPNVARVLEITGAAAVFVLHDRVEDALAALPTD
ncbi:STAS domain-containing protein [Streptomyces hoynatensis]|uniref:Anti-sigma factor antagonist n=1 Tax=Streptomyces hoynatensis TaxID=1141874 RepID=A0A3A9YMQ6_9ACTN|nr:STAS domain-containing protein [Streptomyces hoynatensis]RKN37379.1 anti-sigma factor antagonist [Streptomyces hoynatensis]